MMLFRVLLTAVLGVNPLKKLPFLLSSFVHAQNLLSRNVQGGTFLDAGAMFGDGIDEDTPDTWVAETL